MSETQPTINPALSPTNSELEALCKLVREERVILWVGSGFSSYAGYPTGTQLPSIMLSSLGELPEGAPIPSSASLQEAADYYVRQKERSGLNSFLVEQFGKEPSRCDVHESLALINRIKYIVTTNYDPLFERAYGDKIVVISQDDHLPVSTEYPDKTILHKIHGDIAQPDTIVITSEDYKAFKSDTIVWSEIRSLLAKYSVVFIGYSIRDSNVVDMLNDIYERIGKQKHPYFFIDSKIDEAKRKDLVPYNLHFIEMDATSAISYITGNIIQYAFVDSMERPELLLKSQQIFDHRGFRVDPKFTGERITHISLIPTRSDVHSTIGATISSGHPDIPELREFNDLLTGYSFEPVTLRAPTCDIAIRTAEMNGVFTIDPSIKNFQYLKLKIHPVKELTVDLQLENQPIRLSNLQTKIYNSNIALKLEIDEPDFTFSLYVKHATREGKINFETSHVITDIDRARIIYGLLDGWIQGDSLKILSNGFDGSLTIPSHPVIDNTPGAPSIHDLYQIYSDLFDIQTILKIKLQLPHDEIPASDLEVIHYVATMLHGQSESINEVTTTFNNTEQSQNLLTKKDTPGIQFSGDAWRKYSLFGKKITFPVSVEGYDLELINEEEVRAAIERGDKELRFRWKSTTGKFYGKYAALHPGNKDQSSRRKEPS